MHRSWGRVIFEWRQKQRVKGVDDAAPYIDREMQVSSKDTVGIKNFIWCLTIRGLKEGMTRRFNVQVKKAC